MEIFMNIAQRLLALIVLASQLSLSGMEKPVINQPTLLTSLPSEVHMLIIKNAINNIDANSKNRYFLELCEVGACQDIRALARTNTYFYNLINNPRNTHAMISQIADRCEFPRLTGAIQLKTKGAKQWIQQVTTQDTSRETDKNLAPYLFVAAELNDHHRIAFLLSCVPNLKDSVTEKQSPNDFTHGDTTLMIASREGLLKSVQTLIKAGANVNHTNFLGFTALSMAVKKTNVEIVEELLKAGALIRNDWELHDALKKNLKAQKIIDQMTQEFRNRGFIAPESMEKLRDSKSPERTKKIVDLLIDAKKNRSSSKCNIQ